MIRPLHDFILIQRDDAETKTPGGIIIPDNAQERPQRGKVLAVGPGKWLDNGKREPHGIEPGVTVFPKFVAAESVARVDMNPDSPVLVRASEILAVIA